MKPILITTVLTGLLLGCETTQKTRSQMPEARMQRQISDEELQAISDLHLAAEEGDPLKLSNALRRVRISIALRERLLTEFYIRR